MPIYAYRCESCGHAQDVLQKISDPVLSICPSCGAAAFKKQLTAAGFQLKGSGWYATDFRNGGGGAAKPTAAPAGAPAAPAAGDSGATTTTAAASSASSSTPCSGSCACH